MSMSILALGLLPLLPTLTPLMMPIGLIAAKAPEPKTTARDWPQWMGPTRDNVWHDTGVLDKFPAGGPKVLWRVPVAGGYSGPAVAEGRVFITDFKTDAKGDEGNWNRKPMEGVERVLAYDLTGKPLWDYKYDCKYAISYPGGPRCTPLVHGGKVYTLGAMGHLACLDAAKGTLIWKKELTEEYKVKPALWGYAAHPVIDGDKLITLGGIDGNHIVALNKDTGKEIWKAGSQPEQGYCPVKFHTVGGVRQMIVTGPRAVRGYNPETGERYWSVDYEATNGSIIMTPVIAGEHLFTGGYKGKSIMIKLGLKDGKPTGEQVWRDERNKGVSPVNVQPFVDGDIVYGYNEDGNLIAFEMPSGKQLWKSTGPMGGDDPKGSGTAFIVKNGDRYFFFAETGELVIGTLSKDGYKETDRAKLLEPTGTAFGRKVVWCMPAFADKKMYVRNDKEMICVDLAK
jgi:outer membrane protein assembly factor BamB